MPFGIYGVYRLIRHHLKTLTKLRSTFSERNYTDLSEVKIDHLPMEIRPAIDELNYLFKRIDEAKISSKCLLPMLLMNFERH